MATNGNPERTTGIFVETINPTEVSKRLLRRVEPGLLDPFKNLFKKFDYLRVRVKGGTWSKWQVSPDNNEHYTISGEANQMYWLHRFAITPDGTVEFRTSTREIEDVDIADMKRDYIRGTQEYLGDAAIAGTPYQRGRSELSFIVIWNQKTSILPWERN